MVHLPSNKKQQNKICQQTTCLWWKTKKQTSMVHRVCQPLKNKKIAKN